jgi:hypothetical protein
VTMDRARRVYLASFGAILGYLLVYFLTGLEPVTLPWYYPLEHRWQWVLHPLTLGMDWYGRTLFAALGATASGLLAGAIGRRWTPSNPTAVLRALAAWTLSLFLFATALFLYQLVPRHPFPAPLPPGYVAR